MKQYYELHITMEAPVEWKEQIKVIVEEYGWKFSAIDGDPELGEGVKMYATTHLHIKTPVLDAVDTLNAMAKILAARVLEVVRKKVELVVYDARKGRDF